MTCPWLNNIITDDETSTVPSLKCAELFLTVATIMEVYTQTEVRLTAHKKSPVFIKRIDKTPGKNEFSLLQYRSKVTRFPFIKNSLIFKKV